MAAADVELSVESTVVTVLNALDGIFSLKEEKTTALKDFIVKKDVFAVLLQLSATSLSATSLIS